MPKLITISDKTVRILDKIRYGHKCSYDKAITISKRYSDRSDFEQIYDCFELWEAVIKKKTNAQTGQLNDLREVLTHLTNEFMSINFTKREIFLKSCRNFIKFHRNNAKTPTLLDSKDTVKTSKEYLIDENQEREISEFFKGIAKSEIIKKK